jgi:hypothetical protein
MTEYTAITFIVVKAAIRQQAEAAAVAADPTGGAGTFVPGQPLRVVGDASNTPVAYWCRWNMKPAQRSAFASTIGGPINVLAKGQVPNLSRDKWMFDGDEGQWTPEEVLAALGYARLAATWPPA